MNKGRFLLKVLLSFLVISILIFDLNNVVKTGIIIVFLFILFADEMYETKIKSG